MVVRIGIVGGGLCGLAAARRALELGAEVEVFEGQNAVGGMASSFEASGLIFDIGPHTLWSGNAPLIMEVRELLGERLRKIAPTRGIWRKQRLYRFPFHLGDFMRTSGIRETWNPVLQYILARFVGGLSERENAENMEEWAVRRFGRPLYDFYIRDHVSKNLGLNPAELPALWGLQRIKIPTLAEALTQVFGHKATTLFSYYPEGGIGQIAEALAEATTDRGGIIHTGTWVTEWIRSQYGIALRADAGACSWTSKFDAVINTGPVESFLLAGRDGSVTGEAVEAARKLRYRSTIFVYLSTDDELAEMPCTLCYFPEPELIFNRMYTPAGYSDRCCSPSRIGLCFEIHCDADDAVWNVSNAEIVQNTIAGAATIPFFGSPGKLRIESVVRVRKHYPLSHPASPALRTIERFLCSTAPAIMSAGRLGSHRYVNMDNAMLMGIAASDVAFGLRSPDGIYRIADESAFVENGRKRK